MTATTDEQREALANPYVRIMLAALDGYRGVRLSPAEVWDMMHDDAIATRAANVLERAGLWIDRGKVCTLPVALPDA